MDEANGRRIGGLSRRALPAGLARRFRNEREIFLIISVLLLGCDLRDVVGGRLGLGMKGLNCSSAERSSRDHCQSDSDLPIHGCFALTGLVVCFACFWALLAVVRGDDMRPIWARRRDTAAFHLDPRD